MKNYVFLYIVDPYQWSTEDVRKWFVWHSQQFSVPSGIYEHFLMNGEQLCQLTNMDFNERSPDAGSNLYNQLDVWKTGKDSLCTLLWQRNAFSIVNRTCKNRSLL